MSATEKGWSELPWWKRLVAIILVPVVMPLSLIVVLAILLPLLILQITFYAFYKARFRLFGVPMPPVNLPDDATEETST